MNTWTHYRPETGEVIGWTSGEPEAPGPDFVLSPVGQPGNPTNHYVANGELRTYTPEEQTAKDSLPAGWTWLLPDRIAVDLRTDAKRAEDGVNTVLDSRRAAYPPLAALADALYWQSQGDNTKMDAYLEAVKAVKDQFPKPAA